MESTSLQLGLSVTLTTPFAAAVPQVIAALKAEGFGVLTEINVQATLKEKLGVDFAPYVILGACNPPLAHQALTLAPEVGLLLPCNVVVREVAPGAVEVSLTDPLALLASAGRPELAAVAGAARARLQRVAQALGGPASN
jgi:uncharacterized protein (DUF302 family)